MSKGRIKGVDEGKIFKSCIELSRNLVHQYQRRDGKSTTAPGIVTDKDGISSSILLNGGYIDDEDFFERIIYTGSGGQNEKNIQVSDQVIEGQAGRNNLGLINAMETKTPIRVIRGFKHKSKFSPKKGYRYDGIYFIDRFWWAQSIHGPIVIRFELFKENYSKDN